MKELDSNQPQKVQYCIPTWLRDEQMKQAISRIPGRITQSETVSQEPVAIACFGPSLQDTWEELRKFKIIFSSSGSHKFLIERGIIPTYHVEVDPRAHKTILLGQPHKDVQYLIASCCHPKLFDVLEGYNVKLWHVFANGENGETFPEIFPRGEWAVTGGSSVGLRALTLASFLGYKNLHVFGMDGNFREENSHADSHPNTPPVKFTTNYKGKEYVTTPSLLECARQTFHELDEMPDIVAKFYGEGLVQDMAKDYVRKPSSGKKPIAYNTPNVISPEYLELNKRLHKENLAYGIGGGKHKDMVIKLAESIKTTSVLDYGCGKGYLAKALPYPIWEYDPAIPEKSATPKPADLVVCTDVLEHIEMDKLAYVLDDLKRCIKLVGYFVINTAPSQKTLADGRNAHIIQKDEQWWNKHLQKFFEVGKIEKVGPELHIVVGPRPKDSIVVDPSMSVTVTQGDTTVKFHTPNDTTKWRAETLLVKEPTTIEWINRMQKGDILFDVGANVGGYSVWAGAKGVEVYSFEPEAANYALLVANMVLNSIPPQAYCMAIGDAQVAGKLYLSSYGAGSACHSFGSEVGPDLKPRASSLTQGCLSMTLDSLIELGLPVPTHIKIDVDGFEYKVIKGAKKTLKKGVMSILMEVNTNLPEHMECIGFLKSLGFDYDQAQVDKAMRKDGNFKGCAEFIFFKTQSNLPDTATKDDVLQYMIQRIKEAKVQNSPFDYIYVKDIFPEETYKQLTSNMPKDYVSIESSRGTKGYPLRYTATPSEGLWQHLSEQMTSGALKEAMCNKFGVNNASELTDEFLLIRDLPGYKIGPHTDSSKKVITSLFYLPKDESLIGAGTSTYIPLEEGFTCKGGPHYGFDKFKKVKSMKYVPNSLFAFLKTDKSFHGVEPCDGTRDVLLYDIQKRKSDA